MAIIGFAIGGVIVGAIAHGDYSDHSDYSEYSEYDDAAERRRRKAEALQEELDEKKYEINTYKSSKINPGLQSTKLKNQSGMDISVESARKDGIDKIDTDKKESINSSTSQNKKNIQAIDELIAKIDSVLEE